MANERGLATMKERTEKYLRNMFLKNLALGLEARPLRSWNSCKIYDGLVADGLAVELPEANEFFRCYKITEAGKSAVNT